MNQAKARGGGGGGGANRNRKNKNTKGKKRVDKDEDFPPLNGNSGETSDSIFNSAEEGTGNVEVKSSSEEEGVGVVNASLIVNLSNANVSTSYLEERGAGDALQLVIESGEDVSSDTIVGVSPLEEVKEVVGEVKESIREVGKEVDDECGSGDPPVEPPVIKLEPPTVNLCSSNEELNADSEVEKLMSAGGIVDVGGLPSTVTVLDAPNNVKVYLVGTAHFSHQSHLDVSTTIRATNPTLVLLELCSSRRNILSLDEETVLKEVSEMNFHKVRLMMSNSGAVQGVLHLLLLSMSAQLTRKLGMAPGGEFRVAATTAKSIPGCVILLGDRPFNITISRALAALSFFQKIKLAWQFITSNEDITKEEIERCKELDAISMLLKEMTGEFPSITEVFVNERDTFLAHSLWLAATSEHHNASNRERVVVGVVGMGHVPGMVRKWGKTTDDEVNELLRVPETPISSIIIRKSIKFCWYGLLGYGVYRLGRRIGTASNVNIDFGKIAGEKIVAVKNLFAKSA